MIIGQRPWVEDSIKQIDPEISISFAGYPVSEDPADSQAITGADQAVRIVIALRFYQSYLILLIGGIHLTMVKNGLQM